MAIVVKSMATSGVDGFMVEIEASTIRGQQQGMFIIGLPDQAIKEAGERIQAAIESCGYDIPKDKVIISLAPGDKKKRGSHFDLGMIIALLYQTDQIAPKNLNEYAFIGELSLDGRIRPCTGVLSMITEARKCGVRSVIVPYGNRQEAESVSGINIYPVSTLSDTVKLLESGVLMDPGASDKDSSGGMEGSNRDASNLTDTESAGTGMDFSDVKGQDELIEAIMLGAAGGHNILMIGEPGCGKTMIAQRIPTILPRMTEKESLEVTKIHSISGLLDAGEGLIKMRPFRAPHHNVSLNALIGGGSYAQPGEVSLSHNGVLFLDELAEFSRSTLDALRQPMEDKRVTISRVNGTNSYPANFMFVAAMNPCPCGYYPSKKCRCTDYEIIHYRGKISGPILERIDIQKSVAHVDYFDLESQKSSFTSEQLREKVEKARKIQQERFRNDDQVNCNAQMTTTMIQKYCKLDAECTGILKRASEKFGYSARVIHKLLRLARTSADLDGSENIRREDIVRVLGCRDLDVSSNQMYAIA
ncbi:magnesium chelatase family protein [Oribacterium sp. KHPX15]|uniref:YifB family Mg chelatase-like AAA ATPase n=1 Tax=Oribacterium sp. KHPX15 TaxID=1855342 RepID=UPI0008950C4A|nr:YifB family Mg chelatase-like AAA ATPase [Oribacterium sp. KHPX15]SEA38386.1 magnesium chelatase family protein [Oribacterium sp. KHPX15]